MKNIKKWIFPAIVAVILLVVGVNLRVTRLATENSEQAVNPFTSLVSKPKNGSPVPDFELSTLDGKTIHIDQYRGKPVVINFWATWCAPCIIEMPLLQTAAERHSRDLVVLAINFKETTATIDGFKKKNNITMPILLDQNGKVTESFGVFAYPATFFVDKEGIIRSQYIGQLDQILLQKNLKTIGIETW